MYSKCWLGASLAIVQHVFRTPPCIFRRALIRGVGAGIRTIEMRQRARSARRRYSSAGSADSKSRASTRSAVSATWLARRSRTSGRPDRSLARSRGSSSAMSTSAWVCQSATAIGAPLRCSANLATVLLWLVQRMRPMLSASSGWRNWPSTALRYSASCQRTRL